MSMRKRTTKPFPWFVGIHSLEELATRQSRVCVINILGNESRKSTPVSNEYSQGNVVAGVQYGRRGTLETKAGDIPVYRSVQEVMDHGHAFDTGVIYIPPLGVAQAAAELVRTNDQLKRIIIVTEKVPAKDSAAVRALCQEAGVDVIGANCLGVANAWDHVRIGGALGGDHPEETLKKGSIAIHSNSGNFTTTIAEYLRTAGFGVSTAVSSGKDVYIHFALPEFLWAAQNDPRTKAVALYVEPGGYYEHLALQYVIERRFGFTKPMVCCVTGRWKSNLTRACGHAGAMAGSGDDALSKEKWFDDYFGVPVFDPAKPVVSKRGVRVSSIQYFPEAMKAIFEKIYEPSDFEPKGDLSLKLWLGDKLVSLPPPLAQPVKAAPAPYDRQITEINKQVGAQYLRQNMADKSGASRIARNTQVAELHGKSVLELSQQKMEENLYFALGKTTPEAEDLATINLLVHLLMKIGPAATEPVEADKANGCLPNAWLAAQLARLGDAPTLARSREHSKLLIDLVREFGIDEASQSLSDDAAAFVRKGVFSDEPAPKTEQYEFLLAEVKKGKRRGVIPNVTQQIITLAEKENKSIRDPYEFLLASLAVGALWKPMLEKRMSRLAVEDAIAYLTMVARIVAFSVIDKERNKGWQKLVGPRLSGIGNGTGLTESAFQVLFGRSPTEQELLEFRTVVGLTVTNGPGTLSAKGAKESVSARNDISMAFVGFLANTGRAHGGNGHEAVQFLLDTFEGIALEDPGKTDHGIDLKALANKAAKKYGEQKRQREISRVPQKPIPCVNHPVFRGADVNVDPREQYVRGVLDSKGIYNVFLDFYHHLVQELFTEGVSKNVFCVNIDAVLSVITLKLVWKDLRAGRITRQQVQDIGFLLFLFGRAIGTVAEASDHRDRGTDMDCRTPEDKLAYVL
jgi:succinyl-CoA synthetase alpha subunit/citrate synthase